MNEKTLLGWDTETKCTRCEARAVLLVSTSTSAYYECRGTPDDPNRSDYGDDRCGMVFMAERHTPENPGGAGEP